MASQGSRSCCWPFLIIPQLFGEEWDKSSSSSRWQVPQFSNDTARYNFFVVYR